MELEYRDRLKNEYYQRQYFRDYYLLYKIRIEGEVFLFLPSYKTLRYSAGVVYVRGTVYDQGGYLSVKRNYQITMNDIEAVYKRQSFSFVYLIYCKKNKLYKIGFSSNLTQRLKDLRRVYGEHLTVDSSYRCSESMEKAIHKMLKHRNVLRKGLQGGTEWFKLNKSEKEIVLNLLQYGEENFEKVQKS